MNRTLIIFALLATATLFDPTQSFLLSPPRTINPVHHNPLATNEDVVLQTFQQHRSRRDRGSSLLHTILFAIPVSTLVEPSPSEAFGTQNAIFSPQTLAASASATLTYLSLIAYFDRPRGSLSIPDPRTTLAVRPSRVPGAGLGLFAARPIPRGTVLGTYPGVLRPARQFYDGKCREHPQAVGYSWRFTDNQYVIDPTDSQGDIQDVCVGGSNEILGSNLVFGAFLRFLSVNTALCRINEPPIGAGGCNVSARENLETREVVFELVQDVVSGQELYLDYGLDYDRSRYGPPPAGRDADSEGS